MRSWLNVAAVAVVGVALAAQPARAQIPDPVDVEGQPLASNVTRLLQALEYLGAPISPDLAKPLSAAIKDQDATRLQKLLDRHALVYVAINPESRVKVKRGPANPVLQQGGYTPTLVKIVNEAGVTKQTASAHLTKLLDAQLLDVEQQGRHRYFRLSGEDVGQLLENLMGVAALRKHTRVRTGPGEPALRHARVCYNHLAGELGVGLFDAMRANRWLSLDAREIEVTKSGRGFYTEFGIDLDELNTERRPLCRTCLDWSVRRSHLAGALGTALLDRIFELGWAKRVKGTRIVEFSKAGERALKSHFVFAS